MSFGKNLQFLRRMHNGMTQEYSAGKMNVSRQTVSKWKSGSAYPEIDKVIELCHLFSCSMDNLIQEEWCGATQNYRLEFSHCITGKYIYEFRASLFTEKQAPVYRRLSQRMPFNTHYLFCLLL